MRRNPEFSLLAVCAQLLVAVSAAVVLPVAMGGCTHKPEGGPQIMAPVDDYDKPLPPGQLALRKLDPKDYPDFTQAAGDLAGLRQAVENSLEYLSRPSSQKHFPYGEVTHAQAVASLNTLLKLLDSGLSPAQINDAIRTQFDVYISVGCDDKGKMLFTGYYTPIFNGSLTRTEQFRYPLYKMPAGMVKNDDGSPKSPMHDRRTIEMSNELAGNELVWLGDPFEVYVAHVQGSAKIHLADGNLLTVGYTANNGYDYVSARTAMVKDGKIGKRDGLQAMINYFKAHPTEVTNYTWINPRFVFFAETKDGRPRGCLNVAVTTRRTIATDKKIFPPACLAFIAAKMPAGEIDADYTGFALDQDAGGAIRAAGRADIYLGVGDEAAKLAGRTMNEGKLYYLFLKPSAVPAPVLQPPVLPTPPATPVK